MKEKIIEIIGFNMEPERAELIAQQIIDLFTEKIGIMYKKVKSKVNKYDHKKPILIGNIGEKWYGDEIKTKDDKYPIWFKKHETPFYWYPVFMNEDEFEYIK